MQNLPGDEDIPEVGGNQNSQINQNIPGASNAIINMGETQTQPTGTKRNFGIKRKKKEFSEKPPNDFNLIDKPQKSSVLTSQLDGFIVNVQGMIESANFFDGDAIYCKYDIAFGPDWKLLNGQKSGQSQHACQGEGSSNYFVWNLPFELTLKSTNPSGWPQVVISCFCPDFFGREVLKAYGLVRVPTTPGIHSRTLQMFSPISSSGIVNALGIFLGQKAEIINAPKVMSTGEGREIIRTKSEGSMTIKFNVQLTNMEEFGYNL